MACVSILKMLCFLVLSIAISVQCTLGEVICEHLDQETCAYAVSSLSKRCVLEKQLKRSGIEAFTCRSSEIEADGLKNWMETDECLKACGLNRASLGISSDSLLDNDFTRRLCSPECYDSCPNIVELYFNLAAGEGLFLPLVCKAKEGNARRELMADMRSSGIVAPGPVQPVIAPATAPAMTPC